MADCRPANALRAEQLQCPGSQALGVANDVRIGRRRLEVRNAWSGTNHASPTRHGDVAVAKNEIPQKLRFRAQAFV